MASPDFSGKQRLKQHLNDRGFSDCRVTHTSDESSDSYIVKTDVGGERHLYTFKITDELTRHDAGNMSREKLLAQHADTIETQIKDKFTTTYRLPAEIRVSLINGGSAHCLVCGAEATLPPQRVSKLFTADAELSTPNPSPKNTDDYLSELSDYQKTIARLYLLGRLRRTCDRSCPNSTTTFK